MLLKLLANNKNDGAAVVIKDNLRTSGGAGGDKHVRLWHLALLVGIPAAAVFAYIYFKRGQAPSAKKTDDATSKQQQQQQQQQKTNVSNTAASAAESSQLSPAAKKNVSTTTIHELSTNESKMHEAFTCDVLS
jgi:hypothetical protein